MSVLTFEEFCKQPKWKPLRCLIRVEDETNMADLIKLMAEDNCDPEDVMCIVDAAQGYGQMELWGGVWGENEDILDLRMVDYKQYLRTNK